LGSAAGPWTLRACTATQLKANTRHIVGGIANQAIAALESALLDICGKAYGVPVCALFGGPFRTKMEVTGRPCSTGSSGGR